LKILNDSILCIGPGNNIINEFKLLSINFFKKKTEDTIFFKVLEEEKYREYVIENPLEISKSVEHFTHVYENYISSDNLAKNDVCDIDLTLYKLMEKNLIEHLSNIENNPNDNFDPIKLNVEILKKETEINESYDILKNPDQSKI
jgi:hypothetical protein